MLRGTALIVDSQMTMLYTWSCFSSVAEQQNSSLSHLITKAFQKICHGEIPSQLSRKHLLFISHFSY